MPGLGAADLYFSLCGVELWNQARTAAYMGNGVTPAGARFRRVLCGCLPDCIPCEEHRPPDPGGYQLPELDEAPWYDATVQESRNFAGLLVTSVDISSPVRRRLIQNVGHGAVLGKLRYPGRTIDVKATLIGKTCCATMYGLRWLTQALLGNFCDCSACDAHFLACCPAVDEDGCIVVDGETYVRPAGTPEFQRAADFVRNMHGVGLLEGPEVTKCQGLGVSCGCGGADLMEVEFTLGMSQPWLYLEQDTVVENEVLGTCDPEMCTVEWATGGDCPDECPELDCTQDPFFPPPPAAPRAITPVLDGACVPLASARMCIEVNPTNEREWFESTLIVEVNAGSQPLRNLSLRLFQNPAGLDCCDDLRPPDCAACGSLFVRYVPAGGTLRFDGELRTVTMRCFGVAEVDATGQVFTADGSNFRWLDVACTPYCIAIDRDCFNTGADASVSVYQVYREL